MERRNLANQLAIQNMKKIITAIIIFLFSSTPALAQGVLDVGFGDPPVGTLDPVFTVQNMLPGDNEDRDIIVRNTGSSTIPVILYSQKTEEEIPNWPNTPDGNEFSKILEVTLNDGTSDIYGGTAGTKTLDQFFTDSENGMSLGSLNPNEEITYNMNVFFPHSAGNEYQLAKVVFDLMFEQFQVGGLVINEVYYDPDAEHGSDCSADTCGGNIDAIIKGNGAGSKNIIDIKIKNTCVVVQQNNTTIVNGVNVDSNTGGNSSSSNTSSYISIVTGKINNVIKVINSFNVNVGSCNSVPDKNDEWIELFNASSQAVELDGWILQDNSGQHVVIDTDEVLEPGEFALISRSFATWNYWNEDPDAVKIAIGTDCGNGLDNDGDHLYLFNPNGVEVDFVSWGNDTKRWNPAVDDVAQGHSIERSLPGLDTDSVEDWIDRFPPTPGN